MLKLNYRPVWSEAIEALCGLAASAPDSFWRLFKQELELASRADDNLYVAPRVEWTVGQPNVKEDDTTTDGKPFTAREWSCPNLERLDTICRGATADNDAKRQQRLDELAQACLSLSRKKYRRR
jgi:hypothetical protein